MAHTPNPFSNPSPDAGLSGHLWAVPRGLLPTYSLNLPDPLHFFARPPIPSLGSEERPRSSPDYGQGLPTFSGPSLTGGRFSRTRTGKRFASPSPGWGRRGGVLGFSPCVGASPWGLQALAPPPVLCWNRKGGRVPAARPKLGRVPGGWSRAGRRASWGDCPAGEIRRQRGWDRGKGLRPLG